MRRPNPVEWVQLEVCEASIKIIKARPASMQQQQNNHNLLIVCSSVFFFIRSLLSCPLGRWWCKFEKKERKKRLLSCCKKLAIHSQKFLSNIKKIVIHCSAAKKARQRHVLSIFDFMTVHMRGKRTISASAAQIIGKRKMHSCIQLENKEK